MRKGKVKQLIICALGFVVSCGSMYGINPFGLIFFAAMYMEKAMRLLLCPMLVAAMMLGLPLEQVFRYAVPMIITMVCVDLFERKSRICKKWKGYFIAGISLFLMDASTWLLMLTDADALIKGALEAAFVISGSYLLGGILHFVLGTRRSQIGNNRKEELILNGPGKGKLLAYAESFRNLAGTFSGLEEEATHPEDTGGRTELIWKSKIKENRVVLAGQLNEMAQIISEVAEEIYDVVDVGDKLEEKMQKRLKVEGIIAKNILVVEKKERRIEVYMTVKVERGQDVATAEIARLLSKICRRRMIPSYESVDKIYRDYATVFFEEDANYKILTGVARAAKNEETVSGDNYSFTNLGVGRMVASLSDGMGSGEQACKESEEVIEMLEHYVEAGFTKEAAVQMINTTIVARSNEQMLSSIDICDINLYEGVCDILKIGASTTFIKRESKVETIASTSLPLGVFHKLDYDAETLKLYDGDYIVMVSDGVLDQLSDKNAEEIIAKILNRTKITNPKEMSRRILNKIIHISGEDIRDDMSVLVIGIWKK
ncbi:MAG: SpoIIE family protein phosphatase [Lachnospiraceae bacterium]